MTHSQDKSMNPAGKDTSKTATENSGVNDPASRPDKTDSIVTVDDVALPKGQAESEGGEALVNSGDKIPPVDEGVVAEAEAVASVADEGDVDIAEAVEQVIESNSLMEEDLGEGGSALEASAKPDTDTVESPTDSPEGQIDSTEELSVNHHDDAGDMGDSEAASSQPGRDDLIAVILERCITEDSTETAKEQEELDNAFREADIWIEGQRGLQSAIDTLKDFFTKALDEFEKVDEALPQNIREQLVNRKEGIQLCGRMLDRAQARICKGNSQEDKDAVTVLCELHVEEIPSEILASSPDGIEEKVGELLKSRRIDHNKQISDVRNRARSAEKSFLSGVERQVLPIIDGLDEGKKIGVAAIENMVEQFPEVADELKTWFGIYDLLIGKLESEFEVIGLRPRIASPGEPVDYELYDPVDVEEDPQFEDEQIKEMVRRGYVLVGASNGIDRVVRPGQVVVVKNPPKE